MKERQSRRSADGGALSAHCEALDSIASRPRVLSWKASAGYAPEMHMSPEMQIRLLAQQANFHCVADEALYAECLRRHGIEEAAAREAYRLLQIALGRRLPAVKGVRFGDVFCGCDAGSRGAEFGCLSDRALFAAATKLALGAFTPRAREVIGSSSPEVQAALAQMARGTRPRHVILRPCMRPATVVCAADRTEAPTKQISATN